MSRNKKSKKVDFSTSIDPKTNLDIVIPVYGSFDQLSKTLSAIEASDYERPYKIILVDDESPDYAENGTKFYSQLKNNPKYIIRRNNRNQGFPKTVNFGVKEGKSPLIMILNSDVILEPNAIKIMADHLESSPEVGMVGPKLLFFPDSNDPTRPRGTIQHAGIVFDMKQRPYHRYMGWNPNHPFVNQVKDVNAMTGACLVVKRNIWNTIGGFDEIYGRGTYEDIDLSFRIRFNNYLVRYLPQAVGYHYTGMSAEKHQTPFPLNENYIKFRQKFGNAIPYDEFQFTGLD